MFKRILSTATKTVVNPIKTKVQTRVTSKHLSTQSVLAHARWSRGWLISSGVLVGAGLLAGNQYIYADAAVSEIVSIKDTKVKQDSNVEPATGIAFPSTLDDQTLLGMGVRQVTFMYFNAYAIGLYADNSTLSSILKKSRWAQEYTKDKIIKASPESKWFLSDLLSPGHTLTLLVKTARTTDAPHLRNGFVKFLTNRLSTEKLPEEEKKKVLEALDTLRAQFPSGTFKQGNQILITRLPSGFLHMSFPENGGSFVIQNARVAQWFFEGYLTTNRPISPPFLNSVAEGLERLVREAS